MSERKIKQINQEFINLLFNITILIYEHPWFKEKGRTREEVQNWVAEKLAEWEVYTVPVGMSWGSLCSEEFYKDYSPNVKKPCQKEE